MNRRNRAYVDLQSKVCAVLPAIEHHLKTIGHIPPIYSSVDLRVADFKVAPVDTNIFPAGFGFLDDDVIGKMGHMISDYLSLFYSATLGRDASDMGSFYLMNHILLLHEDFDRNQSYAQNIKAIKKALSGLGMVESTSINHLGIESLIPVSELSAINDSDNQTKHHHTPSWILLNADLTKAPSDELINIKQPILPSIQYGWYKRSKFHHFSTYNKIAAQVADIAKVDSWLLSTYIDMVYGINFRTRIGLDELAKLVDAMVNKIQKKYDEYGISEQPSVFLKPDCGTFGMGILVVGSGDEVIHINKKKRHSISRIRGGVENSRILLQEGVPTNQFVIRTNAVNSKSNMEDNDAIGANADMEYRAEEKAIPAETMFYNIGYNVLTTLNRSNANVSNIGNLNTKEAVVEQASFDPKGNELQAVVNLMAICSASFEV